MEKTKLDNGMNVVFHEKLDTEFTLLALNVKVGADDEIEHHGISHFTEHMMFEGTRKRTAFEIVNAIESIGGYINASTSETNTVYYASVPISKERILFDVIQDLVFNPLLREESVKKERTIIMQEHDGYMDTPDGWIARTTYEALLRKPSTIGSKNSIIHMTRKKILDFYNTWYKANNMSVIIAGREPCYEDVDRYFSKMEPGRVPRRQKLVARMPPQNTITQQRGNESVYVMHSVPTKGYKKNEPYVLSVIRSILDRPMSGRLNVATRIREGLVYSISCIHSTSRDHGLFGVTYSTAKENLKKCKKIVLGELSKASNVDDLELKSSKNNLKGDLMRVRESSKGMIEMLAYLDAIGDVSLFDKIIPRIMKVDKNQVEAVAGKYLTGEYFTALSE